jgi:crotonobetaine/carnitine-CoA ligase
MTECNAVTHTDVDDPIMSGLAGRVRDEYFEVRIADPATDEPLPVGETGELLIRPKEANAFMAGYLNQPKATADAWRNLWFHTGDAAFMDAQGRVHFADRLKDRIRRRGENISAYEIEAALAMHPAVAECVAVGIAADDASGEQEVKAVIVMHEGVTPPDHLEIYRHCERLLPRYSVPRFYEFVSALPKTASNKVQRANLRAVGVSATTWDRDVGVGRGGNKQKRVPE